jgi:hypothetical protein
VTDYVYPSIFLSYFLFFLLACGALFFFIRSRKHGYWDRRSEDAKYRMLEDEEFRGQAGQSSDSMSLIQDQKSGDSFGGGRN